ncbi:MAG TPA: hypothetical protein VF898_03085 [Chloroflexota bacterium]
MAENSAVPPVTTRSIGSAVIHVLSEGVSPAAHGHIHSPGVPEDEWRLAMPDADAEGNVLLGMNVIHIAVGGASILVDTGVDDPTMEASRASIFEAAARTGALVVFAHAPFPA